MPATSQGSLGDGPNTDGEGPEGEGPKGLRSEGDGEGPELSLRDDLASGCKSSVYEMKQKYDKAGRTFQVLEEGARRALLKHVLIVLGIY